MWGLLGLKLCLEARGDAPEELAAVTALFEERSARADIVPRQDVLGTAHKMPSQRPVATEKRFTDSVTVSTPGMLP